MFISTRFIFIAQRGSLKSKKAAGSVPHPCWFNMQKKCERRWHIKMVTAVVTR